MPQDTWPERRFGRFGLRQYGVWEQAFGAAPHALSRVSMRRSVRTVSDPWLAFGHNPARAAMANERTPGSRTFLHPRPRVEWPDLPEVMAIGSMAKPIRPSTIAKRITGTHWSLSACPRKSAEEQEFNSLDAQRAGLGAAANCLRGRGALEPWSARACSACSPTSMPVRRADRGLADPFPLRLCEARRTARGGRRGFRLGDPRICCSRTRSRLCEVPDKVAASKRKGLWMGGR